MSPSTHFIADFISVGKLNIHASSKRKRKYNTDVAYIFVYNEYVTYAHRNKTK